MKEGVSKVLGYEGLFPQEKKVSISFKTGCEWKEPEFEKCLKNSSRLSKVREVNSRRCAYKIDKDQIRK